MSEKPVSSVLRRKAQIGQEQFKARAMTAARALRLTLSKVAEDDMGLALAAIGLTETRCAPGTVLKTLDDTQLLMLLDSPGRGPGAAIMDSPLASALVQQLTMGRVTELREGQPPRKPTRTDAALVAPLLESLFRRAGPLPDTTMEMQLLSGLRFGAEIANTRLLAMSLEADEYAHFSITIDIACGTRQGRLDLLLPIPSARPETETAESEEVIAPPATLEPLVMSLNAQLRVALCRMRMPFSRMAELQPGDTLPLPDGALGNAEILTVAGRKVANGRLGQIDGMRAIRLQVKGHGSGIAGPEFDVDEPEPDEPHRWNADPSQETADLLEDLPDKLEDAHDDLPHLPELPESSDDAPFDIDNLPELPDIPGEDTDFGELPDLPELPEMPMVKSA